MRPIFSLLIIATCFSFTTTVSAEISTQNIDAGKLLCPDADFWGKKMITNVCWSCLFPVRLAGFTLFDDDNDLPDRATDEIFCSCSGDEGLPVFGITAGAWLPARAD